MMKRFACSVVLMAGMLVGLSGCAMCPGPFDETYPAYGGRWQRLDPAHGRVGSVFSNAGTQVRQPGQTDQTPTEQELYPASDFPPSAP